MEWISTKDKLPEINQTVLFWANSLQGEYAGFGSLYDEDTWENKANCNWDGVPDKVDASRVLFWCEIETPNNGVNRTQKRPREN